MSILYVAMTEFPSVPAGEMPTQTSLPRLTLLERVLARAQREDAPADWRRWVLAIAGLQAPDGDLPLGRLLAQRAGLQPAAQETWCIATPVRLRASLSSVHFDVQGPVELDAVDAEGLAMRYNAEFPNGAHALRATDEGLLMRFAGVLAVRTQDPWALAGLPLTEGLPTGRDRGVLQRVGAELEMWLHAQGGLMASRPLSSLWLWGAGHADLVGSPRWPRLELADAALRAAQANHPGGDTSGAVVRQWSVSRLVAQGEGLRAVETCWLQPALSGLGSQWTEIHLHLGRSVYRVTRARQRRWWRAAPPWWEQLAWT
jgi:hypothetical protein